LLREGLSSLENYFVLPESTVNSDPSWFGFLLTVKDDAGFSRDQIVHELEKKGIQTRMLFAGNLIKHPCFEEMRMEGKGYRIVGNLNVTDQIMKSTFWFGVYPGMTKSMIEHIIKTINVICGS
jgi:CDP-6-deoxy-D-xylo-4-hexulose-3-dehydrase